MKRVLSFALGLAVLAAGASASFADDRIEDIQLGLFNENDPVEVNGVIVTAVGVFGVFVQEPEPNFTDGQWSGIWVYTGADNPVGIAEGDLVNVRGDYIEFFDFSEIDASNGGSDNIDIISSDNTVPGPYDVTIAEVNDTGANAEGYESVLIRVDSSDPTLYAYGEDDFGEWYVRTESDGTGDSLLVEQYSGFDYDVPAAGTELEYVQGVLVFNFSQYKIAPRDCLRDLGLDCPPVLQGAYATSNTSVNVEYGVPLDAAVHTDPKNYELASGAAVLSASLVQPNVIELTTSAQTPGDPETVTVFDSRSDTGLDGDFDQTADFRQGITAIAQIQFVADPAVDDASPLFNSIVTVEGTVTAVEGTYYYLQDDDGGMWDGIYSRVAKDGDVAVGDLVQVSGRVNEFFGATQLNFQSGINNWQNLGPSPSSVVTNLLTAADIPYNALLTSNAAEPWEFQLVRIESAFLDSNGTGSPAFGEWELVQGADSAGVDFDNFGLIPFDPEPGQEVNAQGILQYGFDQFRIGLRDLFDIGGVGADAPDATGTTTKIQLAQNSPNPFSASTKILLTMPTQADISVQVIDVSGRLVKTLANGSYNAGGHVLEWDGTNELGERAAAGTYFYRLDKDGQELTRKAILLD